MPTNVPPQYREAEDRFRRAGSIQERIAALQEMLAIMPKHKGTDHLKAQLRSRLSKLMAELEKGSSKGGGGRTEPFSMPKEGGGRATLIGPSNVGKSLLLNKATGAKSRVGAYELSTQEPVPGMLNYEDVRVQLVDTPPISNPSTQGRLYGLLRNTDVFVAVVDTSMDGVAQADEIFSALGDWSFRPLNRGEAPPPDANPWLCKPVVVVANKADIPGALDQYEILEDRLADRFPVIMASAEEGVGFDELAREVFRRPESHPRLRQIPPRPNRRLRTHRADSPAHRRDRDGSGGATAQRPGARLEIRRALGRVRQIRRPARRANPRARRQGHYRTARLDGLRFRGSGAAKLPLRAVTLTLALSHQGRGDLLVVIRAWFRWTCPYKPIMGGGIYCPRKGAPSRPARFPPRPRGRCTAPSLR